MELHGVGTKASFGAEHLAVVDSARQSTTASLPFDTRARNRTGAYQSLKQIVDRVDLRQGIVITMENVKSNSVAEPSEANGAT
jgi:hypothetical protein